MWNAIIEGIRTLTGGGASPFGGALDALKKSPIDLPVKPVITPEGETAIQKWVKNANPVQFPTDLNTEPADKTAGVFKNRIERQKYIASLTATTTKADQSLNKFVNKVNNTTATIKIRAVAVGKASAGLSGGAHFQHGRFYFYVLNYNATLEIEAAFWNETKGQDLSLKMRSRHNEGSSGATGGNTDNRFGGYGLSVDRAGFGAKREDFHNQHSQSESGKTPEKVETKKYFKIEFTVKDDGKQVKQTASMNGKEFMIQFRLWKNQDRKSETRY